MKDLFEIKDCVSSAPYKSILKWGSPAEEPVEVSISIPVYHSFEYFKKALNSAISQTYKEKYFIVVVDNNYEDDVEYINQFEQYLIDLNCDKILYYKNEKNMGPIHNFNRAAYLANSQYFVMCHEDDELCEKCLEELLKFTHQYPVSKELVLSDNILIDEYSNIKKSVSGKRHLWSRTYYKLRLWDFFLNSPSNGCGCLINRDAFLEIGGYNPDYRPSADYGMLSLYVFKFGGFKIRTPLYKYRVSNQNASNNVFYTCIERDEFYRNCMKKNIWVPNAILNLIIKANKKCHTEWTEQFWLHKVIHPASVMDKKIMKVVKFVNSLIHKVFR